MGHSKYKFSINNKQQRVGLYCPVVSSSTIQCMLRWILACFSDSVANHLQGLGPRGRGGGGRAGSAQRFKPLPFNIPIFTKMVPLSYTYLAKLHPFLIPQGYYFLPVFSHSDSVVLVISTRMWHPLIFFALATISSTLQLIL